MPALVWVLGGTAVLGGAAWAVWHYTRPRPEWTGGYTPDVETQPPALVPRSGPGPVAPVQARETDTRFPLQRGMQGERIALLQKGLNHTAGASLDTDGIWGGKTQAALERAGVKTPIDAEGFARILAFLKLPDPYAGVRAAAGENMDFSALARSLGNAVRNRDAAGVLEVLARLGTASDYKSLSSIYQSMRIEAVRKTVVTALVGEDAAFSASARAAFAREFLRIGLHFDARRDRWSLPEGLAGLPPAAFVRRATYGYGELGEAYAFAAGQYLGRVSGGLGQFVGVVVPGGKRLLFDRLTVGLR